MSDSKNGRVTTPGQVVDHNWLVGVPRLSYYIWVSKVAFLQGEHDGGGLIVVLMTTLDHVVDHNWSVGVPRLG